MEVVGVEWNSWLAKSWAVWKRVKHRRRIDLEDKANVVVYAWGAESLLR